MTATANGLRFPAGTFTPSPGAAKKSRMLLAHAKTEAKLTLRTQSTAAASGAIAVRAVTLFNTQSAASQRTAPVENVILRGEMLFESASYRFTPRFDVLDVAIQATDRAQLDKIANEG